MRGGRLKSDEGRGFVYNFIVIETWKSWVQQKFNLNKVEMNQFKSVVFRRFKSVSQHSAKMFLLIQRFSKLVENSSCISQGVLKKHC